MSSAELQLAQTKAIEALRRGDLAGALDHSLHIERLAPQDPTWPRRTAKVYRQMGSQGQELAALDRAVALHLDRGETSHAAVILKSILSMDPQNRRARGRLEQISRSAPDRRAPMPRPSSEMMGQAVNKGFGQVPLHDMVQGARKAPGRSASTVGVFSIPLDGDDREQSLILQPEAIPEVLQAAQAQQAPSPPSAIRPPPQDFDALFDAVADEVRAAERTDAALATIPLFSKLPESLLSQLLVSSKTQRCEAKQVIFRQGSQGDALYVVMEGRVGIIDEGPPRKGLSVLSEGDFFGEMALLSDKPRGATAQALDDTELMVVDRRLFRELTEEDPEILRVLLGFYRDRSVTRLLTTNPIFRTLSASDHKALRGRFRFLEVEPGVSLIKAGRMPGGLMTMLYGSAKAKAPDGRTLGTLDEGDVFGEASLMTGQPPENAVVADSKCLVIELPAKDFQKIIASRPKAKAYVDLIIAKRARKNRKA